MKRIAFLLIALGFPGLAFAQDNTGHQIDHTPHTMPPAKKMSIVKEGGQAAFAAIQEIVTQLMGNPNTDWNRVNIEGLRQHLIDMDNVTMHARIATEKVEDGAKFIVTSDAAEVTASIQAMVSAHVATMNGVEGWKMQAEEISKGAVLTVISDPKRIRALGFIGVMTVGAHHQAHHFALASGQNPHAH